MYLVRVTTLISILVVSTPGCAGSSSGSQPETAIMHEQVYTLGVWRVHDGRQEEFIAAWRALGGTFASLPHPPSGKGVLIQSTTEPTLYYSFGPWRSLEDIAAMREDPAAQTGIARLRELCTEATPGAFRVVAESP